MRRKLLVTIAVLATAFAAAIPAGAAHKTAEAPTFERELPQLVDAGGDVDDLPSPLSDEQRANRDIAVEAVLAGKATPNRDGVVEVAKGQYVQLELEDQDLIWTVTAEFGDLDSPFGVLQGGATGPSHNEIPEPDRTFDNTTIWVDDFSQAYFEGVMYDNDVSVKNLYEEMSSGRYTIGGEVEDWVEVPYRHRHYGGDFCGGIVCSNTWFFVQDSVDAWYQSQVDAGLSQAEIEDYLSQFDVWDRYDQDLDGDFNEPDGYIDHFQVVHSGEGQEAGGGAQGADAIWSHRWYAYFNLIGSDGPVGFYPQGGVQIGDTNLWVGDYTIEPENGGVGVFAHEFAHDLGLPDLYDTSGNTCGSACENSTGFWTLMSSGSWMNDGGNDIGSRPNHMGAWEKLQLGWLDYEVASANTKSTHKLGPSTRTTKKAQAVIVVLPDKEVVSDVGDPLEGEEFFFSGSGNNLDNIMYRSVDLDALGTDLSAMVNYDIEANWDYAYVMVDDGSGWESVLTNLSDGVDPNGVDLFGNGISGSSGGVYTELTADLSAYSGEVDLAFRYVTDVAVTNPGFAVDSITLGGTPISADDGSGWTFDGFVVTDGTETSLHPHYYIAEYRQYRDEDAGLASGPYNFGFLDDPSLGNWVERFPYQDGLLISYWDTSQNDNSTSAHPGEGLILPIDAHPDAMYRADGGVWRSRVQTYDSTFTKGDPTDAITLHWLSEPSEHPSQPSVKKFNDNLQYWNPDTPTAGVINPHTGTQIVIKSVSANGSFMQIQVR